MLRWLTLFFFLATQVHAQDQASTLSRLADRSDVVALVRVIDVTDPDDLHHRVLFAVDGTLKGQAPGVLELTEPAGNGCGQALHGLVPGTSLVAFLVREVDGLRLSNTGSRSLPVADPRLVEHVGAWCATDDEGGRLDLLSAALSSAEPRVRRDAALALAIAPGLERAGSAVRTRALAALPHFLEERDASAAELLVAVARLRLEGALDILVPRYLEGRDAGLAPLVREAIAPLGEAAARMIRESVPADPEGRERAVELLTGLPAADARPVLLGMLAGADRGLRVRVAAALLARGVEARDLSGLVGEVLTQQARERLVSPPRFHSILRGGSR